VRSHRPTTNIKRPLPPTLVPATLMTGLFD
jgi:hypothetical protein